VRLRADAALGPLGLEPDLRRRIAQHQEAADLPRHRGPRFSCWQTPRPQRPHPAHDPEEGILFEDDWIAWTQEMLAVLAQA